MERCFSSAVVVLCRILSTSKQTRICNFFMTFLIKIAAGALNEIKFLIAFIRLDGDGSVYIRISKSKQVHDTGAKTHYIHDSQLFVSTSTRYLYDIGTGDVFRFIKYIVLTTNRSSAK